MNDPYRIVRTVSVTEKSNALMEYNQYTFVVDKRARKNEIKVAVEKLFDRKVKSVNVINQTGKKKRTRYGVGKKPDWKKAIVTLKDGQEAIELF